MNSSACELDEKNDFIDVNKGSITGNVSEEGGEPLPDVTSELVDEDENSIATTSTDNQGNYIYSDVAPVQFTAKETNLEEYPIDVSDQDKTDSQDEDDGDITVDNMIGVTEHWRDLTPVTIS